METPFMGLQMLFEAAGKSGCLKYKSGPHLINCWNIWCRKKHWIATDSHPDGQPSGGAARSRRPRFAFWTRTLAVKSDLVASYFVASHFVLFPLIFKWYLFHFFCFRQPADLFNKKNRKKLKELKNLISSYVAGFPCTPFSTLHTDSTLLGDSNSQQMFQVLGNIKSTQPAEPKLHLTVMFLLNHVVLENCTCANMFPPKGSPAKLRWPSWRMSWASYEWPMMWEESLIVICRGILDVWWCDIQISSGVLMFAQRCCAM